MNESELCEDCPPCGWTTDSTRCDDCPRRPDYYPVCGGCKQSHRPMAFCPPEKSNGLVASLRTFHAFLMERDEEYSNWHAVGATFGQVLLLAARRIEQLEENPGAVHRGET